jgi:hypothetical protein
MVHAQIYIAIFEEQFFAGFIQLQFEAGTEAGHFHRINAGHGWSMAHGITVESYAVGPFAYNLIEWFWSCPQ